jgi:hypothetical protein
MRIEITKEGKKLARKRKERNKEEVNRVAKWELKMKIHGR